MYFFNSKDHPRSKPDSEKLAITNLQSTEKREVLVESKLETDQGGPNQFLNALYQVNTVLIHIRFFCLQIPIRLRQKQKVRSQSSVATGQKVQFYFSILLL